MLCSAKLEATPPPREPASRYRNNGATLSRPVSQQRDAVILCHSAAEFSESSRFYRSQDRESICFQEFCILHFAFHFRNHFETVSHRGANHSYFILIALHLNLKSLTLLYLIRSLFLPYSQPGLITLSCLNRLPRRLSAFCLPLSMTLKFRFIRLSSFSLLPSAFKPRSSIRINKEINTMATAATPDYVFPHRRLKSVMSDPHKDPLILVACGPTKIYSLKWSYD